MGVIGTRITLLGLSQLMWGQEQTQAAGKAGRGSSHRQLARQAEGAVTALCFTPRSSPLLFPSNPSVPMKVLIRCLAGYCSTAYPSGSQMSIIGTQVSYLALCPAQTVLKRWGGS